MIFYTFSSCYVIRKLMHGVLTAVNFSSTRKHQSHTKRNAVFCNKLVSLIDFRFHTTQCNKGKIDDVLMFFTIFCSIGELCMTYSRAALRVIFERFAFAISTLCPLNYWKLSILCFFHDFLCSLSRILHSCSLYLEYALIWWRLCNLHHIGAYSAHIKNVV